MSAWVDARGLSPRAIAAFGICATALGTFHVIGILSGVWIFSRVAQTFAVSPYPDPFKTIDASAPDDLGTGRLFGCEGKDGTVVWSKWNYKLRGSIPGPHRRGVSFLHFLRLAFFPRSEMENKRLAAATQTYFCDNGPLARAARCPSPLSAVLFRRTISATGFDRTVRQPCSH